MAFLGWFDGELRPDAWFDAELQPAAWWDTEIVDTATTGGGNNQVIAFTLDGVAIAAAQTIQHAQSGAITLDSVVVAAAQVARHGQSGAFTLGDLTAAVGQTAQHPQSVAFTLGDVVVAASQTNTGSAGGSWSQSIAFTLDDATSASAQTLQHSQSVAVVLDGVSVAAVQTASHSQALVFGLDDITVSVSQSLGPTTQDQVVALTLGDIDVNVQQIGTDPFIQLIIGGRRQRERELALQKEIESEAVSDAVFEEIQIKPRRTLRLRPAEVPDTTSHLLNEGVARAKQIKQRREEEDLMLMF